MHPTLPNTPWHLPSDSRLLPMHAAGGLDKDKYDVRLISPANHFLFTPMLPSTAVGTLEFRAIQEPVRTIPGLSEYYHAKARAIDLGGQTVVCEGMFTGRTFEVGYDYLVVAVGNKTQSTRREPRAPPPAMAKGVVTH